MGKPTIIKNRLEREDIIEAAFIWDISLPKGPLWSYWPTRMAEYFLGLELNNCVRVI